MYAFSKPFNFELEPEFVSFVKINIKLSIVYRNDSGSYKPTWIYNQFCPPVNDSTFAKLFENDQHLAPCHDYLKKLELVSRVPIPGAGNSEEWKININSGYMDQGQFVSADLNAFDQSSLNVYKNETAE